MPAPFAIRRSFLPAPASPPLYCGLPRCCCRALLLAAALLATVAAAQPAAALPASGGTSQVRPLLSQPKTPAESSPNSPLLACPSLTQATVDALAMALLPNPFVVQSVGGTAPPAQESKLLPFCAVLLVDDPTVCSAPSPAGEFARLVGGRVVDCLVGWRRVARQPAGTRRRAGHALSSAQRC